MRHNVTVPKPSARPVPLGSVAFAASDGVTAQLPAARPARYLGGTILPKVGYSVPFNRPSLIGREVAHIQEAIDRGQLSGDGHFTSRCNEVIAAHTGARAALLTHSGTAALEMAAILCDLRPGDEVIMPSYTFVSTANAVVLRGATPVFVDIDPVTLNIDPDRVDAAVSSRTKAIFAVHYAGFPADMDSIAEIAHHSDLMVVEDAAQALGSSYKGRPAGSLCDMGAFSFHETKNILSGEGGALTINRPDLIERAKVIREKGTNRSLFIEGLVDKYTWVDIGSSFLPGELIAAFLYGQLEEADQITKRRKAIFKRYIDALSDLPEKYGVGLPQFRDDVDGNGHMFYLVMPSAADRSAFIAEMYARRIGTPFHYVPLHSAPAGQRYGRVSGPMIHTDRIASRLVRLPMFYSLSDDLELVIDTCRSVITSLSRVRVTC